MSEFYAKDFIETLEGLRFAVLKNGTEQGKILCFLRYAYLDGQWKKVATDEANALLKQYYPQYLHHSKILDAHLHAVDTNDLNTNFQHYSARACLQALLQQTPKDKVSKDLHALCELFAEHGLDLTYIGITGSMLIGLQKATSDIDLVFYQREAFQQARKALQDLIDNRQLQPLTKKDWLESFQRRACNLSFEEYVWHELRKYNKALINGRKFDISLSEQGDSSTQKFKKLGFRHFKAKIKDDYYGFDYPATFLLNHPKIKSVVSFTATYNGQAQAGEWVEIAGQLEENTKGEQRIVVGSTREAEGEYIKILSSNELFYAKSLLAR